MEVSIDARSFGPLAVGEAQELRNDDLQAVNSKTDPERVRPERLEGVTVEDGKVRLTLAPASWNVVKLVAAR